jgi:hypothetical protein
VTARKATPETRARILRIGGIVAVALVVVVTVGVVVALIGTSTPGFFSRYHLLNRRFVNLEGSAHEGIGCRVCHETSPVQNGAQLTADYYRSLVTNEPLPAYYSFRPPTREACLKCHEDDWSHDAKQVSRIPHPAHLRTADEERQCTNCHKWTAHLEAYMDKHKKMPFSGVCVAYGCHVGTKKTNQCFDCHHILHEDAAEWTKSHPAAVKRIGQNACLESCHQDAQCQQCHTTGVTPEFDGMTVQVGMEKIEQLHVKPEWLDQHGAEARKDLSKCNLCHQEQGECSECHRERPKSHGTPGTWIGRHAKTTKDLKDPRCLTCHKQKQCDECHAQFKEME